MASRTCTHTTGRARLLVVGALIGVGCLCVVFSNFNYDTSTRHHSTIDTTRRRYLSLVRLKDKASEVVEALEVEELAVKVPTVVHRHEANSGLIEKQPDTTESLQKLSSETTQSLQPARTTVPLSTPPIPGPPPNLPWMQSDLRVTSETLMSLPWVEELWRFLNTKVDSRYPVVLTSSNYQFRSSLLNWLARALVYLEGHWVRNILVLALDKEMYELLRDKNISSLYVPHKTLSQIPDSNWNPGLVRVEIARLMVMRLLNSWGYDVINYDNDAFILKNPQDLFDQYPDSHVIGTDAYMPEELKAKWGVVLCMGLVFVKASPETELLWKAIDQIRIQDDQKKLNLALNSLNLTFDPKDEDILQPRQGRAPLVINNTSSTLRVTVISMRNICRGPACKADILPDCYVWHQGGDHSLTTMKKNAEKSRVWLLREDWPEISKNSSLTGKEWLRAFMVGD